MTDEALADEELEEEGAEEAPKSKKKLIIIAAGAVVLLAVIGAAVYFLMFAGGGEEMVEEGTAEAVEVSEAFYYDLPEMTVNLNSADADEQFLKLTVSLELSDQAMVEVIAPRVTRVVDAFQVYLRELRRSDLDGSAGIYRLKDELRRRVNMAVYPAEVSGILFKEILVQ